MQLLDRGDGVMLACEWQDGAAPAVVFLPGFASDMAGTKAMVLAELCAARGQACLRLDYSGHGASQGAFADGSIGRWTQDALAVIDQATTLPLLLVGSSMGGWIALLVALARQARVRGLVGIAAAPDFTERLMWDAMAPPERARLMERGHIEVPSQYGPPMRITRTLIEDGRRHLLLGQPIGLHCPVRLLHGLRDPDVPWETSQTLMARLAAADVHLTLVKDGDHRLSRPQDLDLLRRTVATLLDQDGAQDGEEALAEAGIAPA